jgi:hypothetical protein
MARKARGGAGLNASAHIGRAPCRRAQSLLFGVEACAVISGAPAMYMAVP